MTDTEKRKYDTSSFTREILVVLLLCATTLAVYGQIARYEFVNLDDDRYITENPHVRTGLLPENISWAFTAMYEGTWQPLVWLSFMIDRELHGMASGWFHLTNVFLHMLNSILLFIIVRRMNGGIWQSGFTAGLFALHPLHVESVAWVAERKDVLSTVFWMLTLLSYLWYARKPGVKRYLTTAAFFVSGLMAKPMLVTLPAVLLLLDWWPLGRIAFGTGTADRSLKKSKKPVTHSITGSTGIGTAQVILEKLPLFICAAASCAVAYNAQLKAGALASFEQYPAAVRSANALVSCALYLWKMVWPSGLAVLYPHAGMQPIWKISIACLVLAGITIAAVRTVKGHAFFLFGWMWYLITLVPVIGLIQIGPHAMADRYTYIPLIGIFIITAWGGEKLRQKMPGAVVAASVFVLCACALVTWMQTRVWANSIILFEHALKVTRNNYIAHNNLGAALVARGDREAAMHHFTQALAIHPDYAEAHNNLGVRLFEQGKIDEALEHYRKAVLFKKTYADAYGNLGYALAVKGNRDEALVQYTEALRLNPFNPKLRYNFAIVLEYQGKLSEAVANYTEALKLSPAQAEIHNNLGIALAKQGRVDEAIAHFTEALRINPDLQQVRTNLRLAREQQAGRGTTHR